MASDSFSSSADLDAANDQRLTNADFRKFLTTPRAEESSTSSSVAKDVVPSTRRGFAVPRDYNSSRESAAETRRKKKSYYAKLQKQEMERQAELSKKYRDRSKERREGKSDYADVELVSTTADYRAVGPNAEMDKTSAEKRRQLIQESKFLGGDMDHTHLVKGLDYALLQNIRAEIAVKERDDDEVLDSLLEQNEPSEADIKKKESLIDSVRNKTAKNICRQLFEKKHPIKNELFLPGRMAYVFDLEDEYAETDIPTILIRSKTDCPNVELHVTPSTNDLVINKLTQIMAEIRQGSKDKRRKREKKLRADAAKVAKPTLSGPDINIFDDVGTYKPSSRKSKPNKLGVGPYFEKQVKLDDHNPDKLKANANASIKQVLKNVSEKSKDASKTSKSLVKSKNGNPLVGSGNVPDSYAECYPSHQFQISNAAEESDEEADYSKMDQGNKKGPVGRWDFDTTEEYSSYMSKKEATPKAAFQYGIKMSGGRKTRRSREQNERQKIDRELQKIQNIITKRKGAPNEESFKKPKY